MFTLRTPTFEGPMYRPTNRRWRLSEATVVPMIGLSRVHSSMVHTSNVYEARY